MSRKEGVLVAAGVVAVALAVPALLVVPHPWSFGVAYVLAFGGVQLVARAWRINQRRTRPRSERDVSS